MNLQNQLKDTGIVAHLTLTETGEQLTLSFAKGEMAKRVHLSVAGFDIEGDIGLVPIDVPDGLPNLALLLVAPSGTSYALVPVARLEGSTAGRSVEEGVAKLNERLDSLKVVLDDAHESISKKDAEIAALRLTVKAAEESHTAKDALMADTQEYVNQLTAEIAGLTAPPPTPENGGVPKESPASHEESVAPSKKNKK